MTVTGSPALPEPSHGRTLVGRAREVGEIARALGDAAPVLGEILPELRTRLPPPSTGATPPPAEIREAIAMASFTRSMSTMLNGLQVDEAQFRRDVDRLVRNAKAAAKNEAVARR